MSTRSATIIRQTTYWGEQADTEELMRFYRHYDGYPEVHGIDMAKSVIYREGAVMSITDELRKWGYGFCGDTHDVVTAIADRIDAEHEAACAEAYGDGVMSVPIALDESQWVKLPKDADGVPIRVGDVMDKGEVTCIRDCGKGWEVVLNGLYTYDTPSLHHHKPTVEDVLREFAYGLGVPVADSYVAAAASKLRLADDGEER